MWHQLAGMVPVSKTARRIGGQKGRLTMKKQMVGGVPGNVLGMLSDLTHKLQHGSLTSEELSLFLQRKNPFSTILHIDRSKPFDPAEFIGEGWTIVEEDERSLAISELDLSKVRLETMLKKGETRIKGEEKLRRLKASSFTRLDAKVLQTLWENKHLIPESWKGKFVFFDGTVLQSPYGDRYVLYLYWDGDEWSWNYDWLGIDWHGDNPSAVLAE